MSEIKKKSSKSKHKDLLKNTRLKKLEEKMKLNMKKRKQSNKDKDNG